MKLLELRQLIDLWDRDEGDFRQRLKLDAKRTIESYGFEVTPQMVAAIEKTNWSASDAELEISFTHQP
jgi:hypothetical protein